MSERDRRVVEAMMREADDWHIVDPDTGVEIDQDGGIPVTSEQFKSLLAGESAVVGLTRRVVTLADGPFSIRGGPGSGFKGHEGRPGEVGGSKPSPLGPQEEYKPVKSKRKGQATSNQARAAAKKVRDLIQTVFEEAQIGDQVQIGSWRVLERLAGSTAWVSPDQTTRQLQESSPLSTVERTNLWLVYHGIQHLLETSGLGDGLDADEQTSIQRLGDIVGDFEPSVLEQESRSDLDPADVVSLYLGDVSSPGYLPDEITSDPYLRYQAGRILANSAASIEGSQLAAYNGTDNHYLDISILSEGQNLRGGSQEYDPEAQNAVLEAWGQRALSGEDTPEAATALREAPMDPDFWARNTVMELTIGQWLPTDVTPDLYETADFLNAGWGESPQKSPGGLGVQEAAARVFGGTSSPREALAESEGTDLLDDPQAQGRANQIVQGMYDGTQAWLADRGYHPGDTVRLYRGLGNIEGVWNPLRGPGEGNLQMLAASSWSFDASEAEMFADNSQAAIVAADIPIERLLANSDTGVPCEREGEWLVLGMDGIRGKVYRAGGPAGAWENDFDPTMPNAEMLSNLVTMRSAVCLGFLPVSLPAEVITAEGWRQIAARQGTAPDLSLPTINVEADGDWIGNKLGVYGLTRADVDGVGQPETGKESAQKGQQSGKPDEQQQDNEPKQVTAPKEAGLRAYARAKRALRVRKERVRAAGRQRLQSGTPPVVERQYSGVGGRTTLGPEPTGWEVGKKYEVEGDSYYTLERWFYREPNKGQVYTVDYPVHVTVYHTGGAEIGGRYYYPRATKTVNYGRYVSNPDVRGGPGWHYVSDRSPNFISPLTGKVLYGKPMTARLNPDIGCTASCMNANRDECECSCGGANHGAGHLVQRGGEGSGHFGHEGRPGEVGGSAPSGHATPKTWQDMVAGFQWDAFTPEQIAAYRPGREAVTFFRKQASEEMAKLDPRKITRQEFVGPDHYNLLTSAQIAMMGMDRGNTLRSVLVGRQHAREIVWETAVRHQVALGLLEPRDAWDLGEHSSATSSSHRGTEGEYGISMGPWAPLPERLYHVTTAASAVARDGLLSRDDLGIELSPGLGGGESDTISFTTNFALAQDIDRAFHEARMVANGEFTVAQMAEQARGGFAANAPFSEGMTSGLEGDNAEAYLDRHIQAEASAASPEAYRQTRWNIYQQFLGARARAGGPANPVFFGTDYEALAQLDPADFTILEYRPRPGAMGYQVGGMSEWRTVGGDTVELLGQHQSITPETEGTILAKTWRAIMRSRGVIPRPHPLPKPKEPEKPKYAPRPDRQTYGTSIFNPQLREVVYAWPGGKGLMARAVFEKVAKAQAAGNQDITGMVLGSYTEPMGLAALRYVRADGGDVESLQVLGMVSVGPGFGEEMWVQLAGEAAGRGVGLWVRPAKNARKFYDEIGMTFEETPDGPRCSWTAEQVATVARQAQANTDYLLPPGSTRLIPSFEDKYTETQPVTPASPDLDAPEPEGDKDWQDRYLWTDFVMGKWASREKPDANRILGGEQNQQGEVKPVDGADRVEELSAAWNGGTGLGAIRLSEAVVEAYGGEPIPASVIPKDYLDKFGDKAFERVPESEVLGMAPDERTKRLADQAGKDERMLPGDFPFNLADLAEQVYDGTQTALEEAGIPLESMVRLYRGVQGDPSTLVPEGYDGGWVQVKLYALSPWTFSKAVAAAYATAPQEVGADPLPGSLIAADFPRDRVWSTWATGPGSREHFEFIVLGLEGIRGWLTRVERKGTPGPPEPPKEAKP